ncbi:glycosyltransferase family 2 protein [Granulicella cerasi]|uniref:Glycosyltransferase family 2 protein n=1 Tax=Granulicella cerasi TaxID=741063 RepID=A0ABW1ZAH6_9BACT|nr:glycosyltransferase family A protein [Granulicella cerasi]
MRLSFVVPAYNEEATLAECIESILAQTAQLTEPAQIVVVNNASSDGTREVALRYPQVTLVDEPRKGLTYARQAGLAAVDGDIVANVDADSRLTPGWVARVLEAFAQDEKLVCLSGPLVYYDLSATQRGMVSLFYRFAWCTYAMNRWVLRVGSMVQGGNFAVARRALLEIGGFDTSIAFYGEDTDIARRLSEVGPVRFTLTHRMFSSGRRLRKEGVATMAAKYTVNYLSTTFLKRPVTSEYIDIREGEVVSRS